MDALREFIEQRVSTATLEEKLDIFRKYQKYVYMVLTFLFGIIIIFMFILPRIQFYQKSGKELTKFKKLLKVKEAQAMDKENIKKEIAKLQAELKIEEQKMFTENDFNEFSINILPKIATDLDNRVLAVRYEMVKPLDSSVKIYPLSMSVEGSFFSILNFINNIEAFEKTIRISSMQLKRKTIKPVGLALNIKMEAYAIK